VLIFRQQRHNKNIWRYSRNPLILFTWMVGTFDQILQHFPNLFHSNKVGEWIIRDDYNEIMWPTIFFVQSLDLFLETYLL